MGMIEIVLASASPSRKLLFDRAGIPCTVMPSNADETINETLPPDETVELLANRKAAAIVPKCRDRIVIAADSVVSIDNRIVGKPKDPADAANMLRVLSGRTHRIYTGVCIVWNERRALFSQFTEVDFYELSETDIQEYVESGEPMGKAGSYGIEGRGILLVKGIRGDYANVVGLPMAEVFRRIRCMTEEQK